MENTLVQTQETETKKKKTLKDRLGDVKTGFRNFGRTIANNWDWYDMNEKCVKGALIAVVGFGYIVGMEKFVSQPLRARQELSQAKQEVLFRYGDANKDGYVSQAEEDTLFAEVLKDKGVRCISGERPVYEGGQEVSRVEFTKWINDYMNSKNPLYAPEKK